MYHFSFVTLMFVWSWMLFSLFQLVSVNVSVKMMKANFHPPACFFIPDEVFWHRPEPGVVDTWSVPELQFLFFRYYNRSITSQGKQLSAMSNKKTSSIGRQMIQQQAASNSRSGQIYLKPNKVCVGVVGGSIMKLFFCQIPLEGSGQWVGDLSSSQTAACFFHFNMIFLRCCVFLVFIGSVLNLHSLKHQVRNFLPVPVCLR